MSATFPVRIARSTLVGTARALLSLRAIDLPPPATVPRIFVANHVSHADFVTLWSALPKPQRLRTRPVAGADYWQASRLRGWIANQVFRAVLIDRDPARRSADPVETVAQVLRGGEDVIFFPEGTRNLTDMALLPLKSGIFHLAHAAPRAEIVPAWIVNLDRILPKGAFVPVPLNCAVRFGAPLRPRAGETRDDFLQRLAGAMLALSGREG
ncbi:1-acyl-sn-glycerol-3-phosphate acyltransferase [Paracoccus halophilus]|uniref:1-acyl-sn-glycerol-3-phosphate acyltransferase n=1 Tax=Paracoccus halophilus TaxID=376733 RepID=A0A099F9E1_9RHOB|nr:lysophospholipid acyltransferase family protein [Paracoccus halophilus]KGJ06836.1 acyl-phosphate glycerol 3-phosphate acyltransferase [Paracoccus halophilus]SFA41232.1 1-acyl-sn-glycerol-3-phosphate acyltransferase [Paracoccus halophilus]